MRKTIGKYEIALYPKSRLFKLNSIEIKGKSAFRFKREIKFDNL